MTITLLCVLEGGAGHNAAFIGVLTELCIDNSSSLLQTVPCLCMSASPVLQYANSKYDSSQDIIFSSQRNMGERSLARLPTYSNDFLENRQLYSNEHPDNILGQGQFAFKPLPNWRTTGQPRIVFPSQSDQPGSGGIIRQCWPNPHQAESPGCSVQKTELPGSVVQHLQVQNN